jgi:hypothetical protein
MKLKLNNVRLSYPALFEPKAGPEGGDPKYSAAFIMDRDNNAPEITAIRDGILAVAKDTWGEPNVKWHDGKLMLKKSDGKALIVKTCLRDGAEKPDSPELDNAMFFNASSKNPVPVVDRDPRVHLNAASGRPYGGCYVNASVRLWVQDNAFGKRVNCALSAVQFAGEGKAFGDAPVDPENEFSNLETDSGTQSAPSGPDDGSSVPF